MRLRSDRIGALNMFHTEPRALSGADLTSVQALADVATIGILHERSIHEAQLLTEQLQRALNSRVVIEQAKGAVAERLGVDVDEAFRRLRVYARAHNRRLGDVAATTALGLGVRRRDLRR